MIIAEDNFISQMKLKNESALVYFIDHYGWIIKTIIQKKMINYPAEWDACMNQIFFEIWKNIDSYDEKKAGFKTWISAVTHYQILKYIAGIKSSDTVNIDDLELFGEDNIKSLIFSQSERNDFRQLLHSLTPEDQDIFTKLFWEELSYKEVAESMGMPIDRVYSRVSRGKKKLRKDQKLLHACKAKS